MDPTPLLGGATHVTPANMEEALQQAIDIEIATLPTYLSTYYSINRVPDQDAIKADLASRLEAKGVPAQAAAAAALDMSADIMVLANKCGAMIISVAVEEMLHMALSSNVKQALFGPPQLVGRSPQSWPAHLPGQIDPFPIDRAPLSLAQLETFMRIELPEAGPDPDLERTGEPLPMTTIGEFYASIESALCQYYEDPALYDDDRPQLVPGRGFYAQNNINTNYYDKQHRPNFANSPDSGDLVGVDGLESALAALSEIVRQGEGHHGAAGFGPGGEVLCRGFTAAGDYDASGELAHFYKFNDLYCEIQATQERFRQALDDPDYDLLSTFVYPNATNPVSADYPAPVKAVSDLTNALYTYLFIMTEACYRSGRSRQFEIFMFGIHKTMMWVLGSLCEGHMVTYQYIGADGKTYNAAPTFEHWAFDASSSPKSQIIALHALAAAGEPNLAIVGQRIHDLPDVPLQPYLNQHRGGALLA